MTLKLSQKEANDDFDALHSTSLPTASKEISNLQSLTVALQSHQNLQLQQQQHIYQKATAEDVDKLVQKKWLIRAEQGDIRQRYEFQDRIGDGAFGCVYRARDIDTGQLFAVKTVIKERPQDVQTFINEINMLRELDHPNVLNIYEVWEQDNICSIVTEFMPGGDLLSYCNSRTLPLPQPEVCEITRHLMRALCYLHSQSVVHADVKLENCLFASLSLDSLHLIDYGLSMKVRSGQDIPYGTRGTLNYMAPELLSDQGPPRNAELCSAVDVWAAGIILYSISTGILPFNGASEPEIIQQMRLPEELLHSRLTGYAQFNLLNPLLKDLILQMLRVFPQNRLTSSQVLRHPWMKQARDQEFIDNKKYVGIRDLKAMAVYGKSPILKKLTLMFLAVRLDDKSCAEIKNKFESADRDENGSISPEEFNQIFVQGTGQLDVPMTCTKMLFEMMDTNKNGSIDFSEFKAALLRTSVYLNNAHLRKAFQFFDKDRSGYITKRELQSVFETFEDLFNMFETSDYSTMIAQADTDKDGRISYDEFVNFVCRDLDDCGIYHI